VTLAATSFIRWAENGGFGFFVGDRCLEYTAKIGSLRRALRGLDPVESRWRFQLKISMTARALWPPRTDPFLPEGMIWTVAAATNLIRKRRLVHAGRPKKLRANLVTHKLK
jgi:hypothetical protein